MKIDNGNSLIPALNGSIAIAYDEINYSPEIRKDKVTGLGFENIETRKLVMIYLLFGKTHEINLADVTNQPTWTLDQDGINQAMTDINSWI